ncbi:MAG: VanZ family protein [Thermoanaerobaculia bacterium]
MEEPSVNAEPATFSEQREVIIRSPLTVLLMLDVTLAIISVTVWTSGKSYSKVDPIPFEEIRHLARRIEHKPVSTQLLAVIVVPIIANVLLFVPWGFFTFISLYTSRRPTVQTYVLTILLGICFTLAVETWQYFLPSRVADVNDVIWNTVGTIVGAMLGHLRLRVRFEFL